MNISVTKHKIKMYQDEEIHKGEYAITKFHFTFSAEYTDSLVKVALFTIGKDTYKMAIINNECNLPSEILENPGDVIFGVYAYEVEDDALKLRYSPTPIKFKVSNGSYKLDAVNGGGITPTQFEQYMQMLNNAFEEIKNGYYNKNEIDNKIETITDIENDLQEQITVEKSRIDNISTLEEGSTTGDAELIDSRVGYNGIEYSNSGNAIRNQVSFSHKAVSLTNVGKEIFNSTWSRGGISWSGINNQSYTVRSSDKMTISKPIKLIANNGYLLRVAYFDEVSDTTPSSFPNPASTVIIQQNRLFMIMIQKSIEDTTIVADIDEFVYNVYSFTSLYELINSIYIENKNNLVTDEFETVELTGTVYDNKLFNSKSSEVDSNNNRYLKIDSGFEIGSKLKIKAKMVGNNTSYHLVNFLDENNSIFSHTSDETVNTLYTDYEIIIPLGTKKIIVNSKSDTNIVVNMITPIKNSFSALKENFNELVSDLNYYNTLKTYNLSIADALIREAKKNTFEFAPLDNGYISFIFDDLRADIDKLGSIFAEYNFPVCLAALADKLDLIASGLSAPSQGFTVNMTRKEVCDKIVENGGEILSHYGDVITTENQYDYEFMYEYFIKNKEILEENGYKIRGIIRAGGTGSIYGNYEIWRWLIGNYEYANFKNLTKNYNIERLDIRDNLDTIKSKIDDAILNHKWIIYYGHDLDNLSNLAVDSSHLRDVLDYCVNTQITVTNCANIFDNFSSSKFLESIRNN